MRTAKLTSHSAAAQHVGNKVSESLPQSTMNTAEQEAIDKRAREYLARRALGIPDQLQDLQNGTLDLDQKQTISPRPMIDSKEAPNVPKSSKSVTMDNQGLPNQ